MLLGLGLDEFSMSPQANPAAKATVRSLALSDCSLLPWQMLRLESANEVKAHMMNSLTRIGSFWA